VNRLYVNATQCLADGEGRRVALFFETSKSPFKGHQEVVKQILFIKCWYCKKQKRQSLKEPLRLKIEK
jgi:hypothetical protein